MSPCLMSSATIICARLGRTSSICLLFGGGNPLSRLVHTPSGPLKSASPLSVDIPAPVNPTVSGFYYHRSKSFNSLTAYRLISFSRHFVPSYYDNLNHILSTPLSKLFDVTRSRPIILVEQYIRFFIGLPILNVSEGSVSTINFGPGKSKNDRLATYIWCAGLRPVMNLHLLLLYCGRFVRNGIDRRYHR